jgi:hypothetical protein
MLAKLFAHLRSQWLGALALFVALGGSAYAVSQINGHDIENRSIPGNKIERNALTGKEVREGTLYNVHSAAVSKRTKQLKVSVPQRHLSRLSAAQLASASTSGTDTIIKLSEGESATLIQSGPFTYTAKCVFANAAHNVDIDVTSSEPGTWIDGTYSPGGPVEFGPGTAVGDTVTAYSEANDPDGSGFREAHQGLDVVAPSGAALHIGKLVVGPDMLGADCIASAFAVG